MTSFDTYSVGDRVYCLAWIGKQFDIVAKDDERGIISLQGTLENTPQGAQVDVFRSTLWMLTKEPWDQLWYWPDRKGERYLDVFKRFVSAHPAGDIVTGYLVEGANPLQGIGCTPDRAMAFRILASTDMTAMIEPVAGWVGNESAPLREARKGSDVRWVAVGPAGAARVRMVAYRWGVAFGEIVLNGEDFSDMN
ncbi:MAG: hypothetical protein ABW110_16420 [Steroidobacteraceae bacterium]